MPKVDKDYSLYRTYVIFRTLGLRHLVVVNVHNHVVGMITRKDLMPFMMQERLEKLLEPTTSEQGDGKHIDDVRRKSADSVEVGPVCRPTDDKSPHSVENEHYRGPYVLLPSSRKNSSVNRTTLDGLQEEVEGDCVTSSAAETEQLRDAAVKGDAAAVQIVVSEPPNNNYCKQEWV